MSSVDDGNLEHVGIFETSDTGTHVPCYIVLYRIVCEFPIQNKA